MKTQGESGKVSPPDEAIYQIPVMSGGKEIAKARVSRNGTITISSGGPCELGEQIYKQLKNGDATGISLNSWIYE